MASRRSQPYRRGRPRQKGQALAAMVRGRSAYGRNPADSRRAFDRAHPLRRKRVKRRRRRAVRRRA